MENIEDNFDWDDAFDDDKREAMKTMQIMFGYTIL
jgi:hypothetical protein